MAFSVAATAYFRIVATAAAAVVVVIAGPCSRSSMCW